MGFRDVTDEINMPLRLSEGAGTIPVMLCPWIVPYSKNWIIWRSRVVMATERDGYQGTWKKELLFSTLRSSDLCGFFPAAEQNTQLDDLTLCLIPFTKQTYKKAESRALVSGPSTTLSMANISAIKLRNVLLIHKSIFSSVVPVEIHTPDSNIPE